jgi:hypothetical protein
MVTGVSTFMNELFLFGCLFKQKIQYFLIWQFFCSKLQSNVCSLLHDASPIISPSAPALFLMHIIIIKERGVGDRRLKIKPSFALMFIYPSLSIAT